MRLPISTLLTWLFSNWEVKWIVDNIIYSGHLRKFLTYGSWMKPVRVLSIVSTNAVVGKLMIFCVLYKTTSFNSVDNSPSVTLTHVEVSHVGNTFIDGLQHFVVRLWQKQELTGPHVGHLTWVLARDRGTDNLVSREIRNDVNLTLINNLMIEQQQWIMTEFLHFQRC